MALGTITNVVVNPHSSTQVVPIAIADVKMTITTVQGESSYVTGGDTLTASQLGFLGPSAVLLYAAVISTAGSAANSTGSVGYFNTSTGKLQSFVGAGTEVAATTNVSGNTYTILAFGID